MTPDERQQLRQAVDARRREVTGTPADGIVHGTVTSYRAGCRCDRCREAANDERRARTARMPVADRRAMWRAQGAARKARREAA